MKRITLAILALIILFPALGWGATTYYLRYDGTVTSANKANATSCSAAATALNVAQHNAATFAPGDIIKLCSDGGIIYLPVWATVITPPTSGTVDGNITYESASTPLTIIDGSIDAKGSGDWTSIGSGSWTCTMASLNVNQIFLNGLPGKIAAIPSSVGEWVQDGTTLTVNTGGDDAAHDPATFFTSARRTLNDSLITISGKNYIVVRNLAFQYYRPVSSGAYNKAGIVIYNADHIVLRNNTFYECSSPTIESTSSTNVTIDGNTFLATGYKTYGDVTTANLSHVSIDFSSDNTTVKNNSINGSVSTYDGTGIPYTGSAIIATVSDYSGTSGAKNLYIASNTVTKTYGYGINVTGDDAANCGSGCNVNGVVELNTLTDGRKVGGVDSDALSCGDTNTTPSWAYGLTFRRNRVDGYGNSCGQSTNSWLGVKWVANVFSNCGVYLAGWGGLRIIGDHLAYNNTIYNSYGNGITCENGTTISNNIISTTLKQTSSAKGYSIQSYSLNATGSNNLLYGAETATTPNWSQINGVAGDPLFTSATDFSLQLHSPAVGAGTNLGATYATDFDGVLQGCHGWDLGAKVARLPNGETCWGRSTAVMK